MKKQPGDRLSPKQWQKLADLLMLASHDPLIEESGKRERWPNLKSGKDKGIFQTARMGAIYYMGYAPRKGGKQK